jgi:predicted ATPase
MVSVDEMTIRFAHDKIEQAAYELMTEPERLQNHMRFGLALCSHALDSANSNDEVFFLAVDNINRGGAGILEDSSQKVMIAALNMKAGKRSIELAGFASALKFFEHGISFLDDKERWSTHRSLALELFDAAVETACALNESETVRRLSEEVLACANCDDDKLNCLYAVAKSLRVAYKFQDAMKVACAMLDQLGESMPRPSDDIELASDIEVVKLKLDALSDGEILNMNMTQQEKRDILLLNIYHDLNFVYNFVDSKRIADTSLRMAQITLTNGLSCMAPLAFAQFAIVLVNNGDSSLGYRASTLALRLLDKIHAQRYTSSVIALVGTLVSWVAEPLQSISESHLLGFKLGQRNGDVVSGRLNYLFYLQIFYMSGQSLHVTREKSKKFSQELVQV